MVTLSSIAITNPKGRSDNGYLCTPYLYVNRSSPHALFVALMDIYDSQTWELIAEVYDTLM